MQSALVTVRQWAARGAVIVVLAAVGLGLPATPAQAHGQLAMSKPLADTIVNDPLERVELYFTEQPAPNAHFTLTAPGGGRVDNGWTNGQPMRLDKPVQEYFIVNGIWEPRVYNTGFPAMVAVAHWPAKGTYVAAYLSVASDGEAVRGSVTFTYNGATSPAPAGWTPPTKGPDQALLDQSAHGAKPGGSVAATAFPVVPPSAPAVIDDLDNTAAAPVREPGGPAVWLLPGALVVITALIIGHAARKPPLPKPKPARRRRTPAVAPRATTATTDRRTPG